MTNKKYCKCPNCGSSNVTRMYGVTEITGVHLRTHYICEDCQKEFDV